MAKKTPFKAAADFEKELTTFANKYKTIIHDHSDKISDYFEIACYNMIIKYYEQCGYKMEVRNLKEGKFKYKCSPNGHLENFSYFCAMTSNGGKSEDVFYVFHNATVQSAHDKKVFTSPDIVVSKVNKSSYTDDHYQTKKKLSFIPYDDMITFCEAKHLSPFPELMLNFIGTVNELKPKCLTEAGNDDFHLRDHIAPSLMMSGSESKPCKTIRESLERRYFVNYFDNLFDNPLLGGASFLEIEKITTLCEKGEEKMIDKEVPNRSKQTIDFTSLEEELGLFFSNEENI